MIYVDHCMASSYGITSLRSPRPGVNPSVTFLHVVSQVQHGRTAARPCINNTPGPYERYTQRAFQNGVGKASKSSHLELLWALDDLGPGLDGLGPDLAPGPHCKIAMEKLNKNGI